MPASLISTPGAITSLRPASWRWTITTARRGGRGINNRGSRPFGARASPPGWIFVRVDHLDERIEQRPDLGVVEVDNLPPRSVQQTLNFAHHRLHVLCPRLHPFHSTEALFQ